MTRSVNRALDLLEVLRDTSQPMSLSELALAAGMDKATTMRIARDLLHRHYLEQSDDTKRYTLGLSILELADSLWAKDSITQNTLRYLEDLRDKTLQTVALCARFGDNYLVSRELPSLEPIKFAQGVGTSKPIGGDAAGLVMLAFGKGASEGIQADVDRSVLEKIRDDGYAYSVGRTAPRVATVAAAVRGPGSSIDSAVSLSWLLDGEQTEPLARRRYSSQVMGCAQRISRLKQGQERWQ